MSKKLYFRYGTMNSSKTANLLMVAHNYKQQGKKIVIIKPAIDERFGIRTVKSRAGLESNADIVLKKHDILALRNYDWENIDCALVDEAQFLTTEQIDELRVLTIKTPVICYGLRTDFRSKLFPGAKRLMELADSIEEIKTICTYCSKKSIINMKHVDGKCVKTSLQSGDSVLDLGCEEKYLPTCWKCWYNQPVSQADFFVAYKKKVSKIWFDGSFL
jgi:thymidine kinase